MSDTPNLLPAQLPDGEQDPNLLYIAVGRSIHAWEQMETQLARLCLIFQGQPHDDPNALSDYGRKNGQFAHRMAALESAAEAYFVNAPDQAKEGALVELLREARELAIERHRIAHGHVTAWAYGPLPEIPAGGRAEINLQFAFRWAPPFYGAGKLRTDAVGRNAAAINEVHDQFQALNDRALALIDALLPA